MVAETPLVPAREEQWRWRKHRFMSIAFGLLVGYIDIVLYLRCGAFAATQTGNTILLMRALDPGRDRLDSARGPWFYGRIIFFFVAGLLIYFLVERKFPTRGGSLLAPCIAALVVVTEVHHNYVDPEEQFVAVPSAEDRLSWLLRWHTSADVFSLIWGIVHGLGRTSSLSISLTSLTGHYSQVAKLTVGMATQGYSASAKWQLLVSLSVILGIFVGAFLGLHAVRVRRLSTQWALLPAGLVLSLMMWTLDSLARPHRLLQKVDKLFHAHDDHDLWYYADDEEEEDGGDSESSSAASVPSKP